MAKDTTTKYEPANQREVAPPDVELSHPGKEKKTCCQKCAIYSCFTGFVFIVAAIVW
jgi:hypothetical protein